MSKNEPKAGERFNPEYHGSSDVAKQSQQEQKLKQPVSERAQTDRVQREERKAEAGSKSEGSKSEGGNKAMTKAQLKQRLDERGVQYDQNAEKEQLQQMVDGLENPPTEGTVDPLA